MYVNKVEGHELAGLSLYKCSFGINGAPLAPTPDERLAAFRLATTTLPKVNPLFPNGRLVENKAA